MIDTLNFFHISFLDGPSADFDLDGDVDSLDLNIWESAYGVNTMGDTDDDGDTDGADFLAWQRQFGAGLPSAVAAALAVPEPNSAPLALLTMAAFLVRMKSGDPTHTW